MLSVVFGLTRFHTYTYGRKVAVYNDHKPFAAVLKRPVGENPIRLQRMLCRIMGYVLDFKYIKGKDLLIAYALAHPTRLITLTVRTKTRLKPSVWLFKIEV